MVKLPLEKKPPEYEDPKVLLIYSRPKTGKTTVFSHLDHSIILDFESGGSYVAARRLKIIGLRPPASETHEELNTRHDKEIYYLTEVIKALREYNPYTYGIADTLTTFEGWIVEEARDVYMKSVVGKGFNRWSKKDEEISGGVNKEGQLKPKNLWDSILSLPNGAGYMWVRDTFEKWLGYITSLFPYTILSGHLKVTYMAGKKDKAGTEVEVNDVDLIGKNKVIATALVADAIGFLHREGNKTFLSFVPSDEILCGTRISHLEGKDILLSEKQEDGTIKTYWQNVYKNLPK